MTSTDTPVLVSPETEAPSPVRAARASRLLTLGRQIASFGTIGAVCFVIDLAVYNLVGLGIAAACLFVSHYVLGLRSTLADNVAGNGVGLVLGTAFRFAAYKALVFRSTDARPTKEAPA